MNVEPQSSLNPGSHGKSTWPIPFAIGSRRTESLQTPRLPRSRPSHRMLPPLYGWSISCRVLCRNWSVFGLAVDLGTIQSTATPVTWSVGYVRDPSITYSAPGGVVQQRRPYYVTQYKSVEDAVSVRRRFYPAKLGLLTRLAVVDRRIYYRLCWGTRSRHRPRPEDHCRGGQDLLAVF